MNGSGLGAQRKMILFITLLSEDGRDVTVCIYYGKSLTTQRGDQRPGETERVRSSEKAGTGDVSIVAPESKGENGQTREGPRQHRAPPRHSPCKPDLLLLLLLS